MSTQTEKYYVDGSGTSNPHDNAPSKEKLAKHAYYLYLTTNQVTGTIYVGMHRSNPNESWRSYMGSGSYLKTEARGYGVNNFSKQLLAWAEDGLEAKLLEGRFISKALLKPVHCYNSNNSESIQRDPITGNERHFAFKASFRGRQRIEHNLALLDKHTALTRDPEEVIELAKLKAAWELALSLKEKRFAHTGHLDPKDWAENKYGFNANDERD